VAPGDAECGAAPVPRVDVENGARQHPGGDRQVERGAPDVPFIEDDREPSAGHVDAHGPTMSLSVFEGDGLDDAPLPSSSVPDEKALERAPLDERVIRSGELPGVGIEERAGCRRSGLIHRRRGPRFILLPGPFAKELCTDGEEAAPDGLLHWSPRTRPWTPPADAEP
jgi:hypothetical protein